MALPFSSAHRSVVMSKEPPHSTHEISGKRRLSIAGTLRCRRRTEIRHMCVGSAANGWGVGVERRPKANTNPTRPPFRWAALTEVQPPTQWFDHTAVAGKLAVQECTIVEFSCPKLGAGRATSVRGGPDLTDTTRQKTTRTPPRVLRRNWPPAENV